MFNKSTGILQEIKEPNSECGHLLNEIELNCVVNPPACDPGLNLNIAIRKLKL